MHTGTRKENLLYLVCFEYVNHLVKSVFDAKTKNESGIMCARCDEYLDSNRPLPLNIRYVSLKMLTISRIQSHSPRMHMKTNES